MKNLLKGGKWPLNRVFLACLMTGIFTYAISRQCLQQKSHLAAQSAPTTNKQLILTRLKDFRFTQPLLMADLSEPDAGMKELMDAIQQKIASYSVADNTYKAAVYIRNMTSGDWNVINENELFDPGSILKLPVLIGLLKQAESNPQLLDQRILYNAHSVNFPKQTILSSSIQLGKTYTVRELLNYMIVESDNEANALLFKFASADLILRLFSDLNLEVPDKNQLTVRMNAKDVSKFLRVIYNSSYTNPQLSEYSMELLEKTKFKDGMKKAIPEHGFLVHKFGERGYPNTSFQELSETGIIYLNDQRILLTVMTKGSSQAAQAASIVEITKIVCDWIENSRPI